MTPLIIEIQPLRSGWQVRGVKAAPTTIFFVGPAAAEHAIDYALECAQHSEAEIRLLARNGEIITSLSLEEKRLRPASRGFVKLRSRRSWAKP